jgi:hypothetical protein
MALPVLRDLPAGGTVTLEGLSAADAVLWTFPMTAREGMLIDWFEAGDDPIDIPANKLRITFATATDAKIGWIFAGSPVMPAYGCERSYISPAFLMGGDTDTAQLFFGSGYGGLFEWDRDLGFDDLKALYGLIDYAKRQNNEPVVAISDPDELDIVAMMRIDTDSIQVDHVSDYRKFERTITDYRGKGASLSLPFAPVYQP